jgi:essential nuclear protein 1
MGKTKRKGDKVEKGGALSNVLQDDMVAKNKIKKKVSEKLDSNMSMVDEKLTRRIIKTVQSQAKQETMDNNDESEQNDDNNSGVQPLTWSDLTGEQNVVQGALPHQLGQNEGNRLTAQDDIKPMVAEEDEMALEMFFTSEKAKRGIDLNAMIKERLGLVNEAIPDDDNNMGYNPDQDIANMGEKSQLQPELQSIFVHVGQVMSQYRSGKFPKAFKEIPHLKLWEEALWLTTPNKWSAASLFQATRTFASSMSEQMAQRFYNLVLLPRVRDDIQFYGKLNFHIYEAIMKAVFKPIAFLRGFLLPLCQEGNCSLKEATIICAIIRDKSIPLQHTSVAMMKIAEMDYNGANSLFLRTMIEKKYALPFRVIDAMVFHFLRFKQDRRDMPVLWHQCWLSFVKIYGKDCSEEQKIAMLKLTFVQKHREIGPAIREVIKASCPRDLEIGTGDDMMTGGVF